MGLWSIIVNGVETNFDSFGFYIAAPLGAGMPDPQVVTQPYAVLDGAQFQRTRVPPRVLTLRGTLVGGSLSDLHAKRKALIAAVRRDNRDPQTPITLKYTGGPVSPVYIDAYYETGLQLGERRGFSEPLGLRFLCPDPLFYGSTGSQALAAQGTLTVNGTGWAIRSAGVWSMSNSRLVKAARASNGDALLALGVSGVWRSGTTDIWLGSVSGGGTECICEGPDGAVYVGGTFASIQGVSASGIARYNGAAWSALGSGVNGIVRAVAVGQDGKLYAGGGFTTAGGAAIPYLAAWNGSTWSALGSGVNNQVYALAVGLDGKLYAGGMFTTAGGAAVPALAAWNGLTWSAVGSGVDLGGIVYALAVGPDGSLYAGGLYGVRQWNGSTWRNLGSGLNGSVRGLFVDSNGLLYACGVFTNAGGVVLPDRMAIWNGSAWLALDLDLPSETASNYTIIMDGWNRIHVGFDASIGTATRAGVTTVTNTGSAAVSPTVTISAPAGGRLYQLVNITTGASIYFHLDMLAGETVTIDTGRKTVTSSFRGNLLRTVLAGSQLGRFALLPGANQISLFHASATATATMSWTNRYWSLDG